MQLPTSIIISKFSPERYNNVNLEVFHKQIKLNKERIFNNVNKNISEADKKRKEKYKYKNLPQHDLVEGDKVYISVGKRKAKLESPTKGPYFFEKYLNKEKHTCLIFNPSTYKKIKVSSTRITPIRI